jgi:hypothetical protein
MVVVGLNRASCSTNGSGKNIRFAARCAGAVTSRNRGSLVRGFILSHEQRTSREFTRIGADLEKSLQTVSAGARSDPRYSA